MSNQKNNLGMFSQRVEAINSRFILADRHISGLLKCVATIPELTAVVGETLKNVSYADEYDKARVVLTKNGKSVCKFVMPNDKKRIIAFTVCLLTEFDSGRRSLLEFLTEFFYDDTKHHLHEILRYRPQALQKGGGDGAEKSRQFCCFKRRL